MSDTQLDKVAIRLKCLEMATFIMKSNRTDFAKDAIDIATEFEYYVINQSDTAKAPVNDAKPKPCVKADTPQKTKT